MYSSIRNIDYIDRFFSKLLDSLLTQAWGIKFFVITLGSDH